VIFVERVQIGITVILERGRHKERKDFKRKEGTSPDVRQSSGTGKPEIWGSNRGGTLLVGAKRKKRESVDFKGAAGFRVYDVSHS